MAGRIPPANIPLIDGRGFISTAWYRFFAQSENLEPGVLTVGTGLTGGGSVSAGVTISIADHGVGDLQLREGLATSVIGRFQGSQGTVADIRATADNRVLGRFGGQLVFKDISLIPATVGDGDKGVIVVSGGVWSFDTSVVTPFALTFLDDANAGAVRTTIGAEAAITAGTTSQYWRGDKSWQTLNAAAIAGLGTGVATALAINVGSAGAFVTFNGAGGTPSSLTLTNATGLPIAGIVASTTTAIGVGSVELGHATDTTLARSGAGDVTIEGNAIYRAGGTDVPVADGGTGRSTSTTAYALIAAGTTATGAHQTLAAGATTEILVGGGTAALPVWTTATGTGSPVRGTAPQLSSVGVGAAGGNSAQLNVLQTASLPYGMKITNRNSLRTWAFTVDAVSVDDNKLAIVDLSVGNIATLSATGFACVSTTTASAANLFQSGSNTELLRSTSSLRYKGDVRDLDLDHAALVMQLRPISYLSKARADDPEKRHWGFIAEEADKVVPWLVNYDEEGRPDGFQYERVIVGLLAVVKDQRARLEKLEGAASL